MIEGMRRSFRVTTLKGRPEVLVVSFAYRHAGDAQIVLNALGKALVEEALRYEESRAAASVEYLEASASSAKRTLEELAGKGGRGVMPEAELGIAREVYSRIRVSLEKSRARLQLIQRRQAPQWQVFEPASKPIAGIPQGDGLALLIGAAAGCLLGGLAGVLLRWRTTVVSAR